MLYRPKFCASCGEKIERVEWGLLTSRRFCEVCESQNKGYDLIPRAVVGAGLLVGVLGLGFYLKSGSSDGSTQSRLITRPANQGVAAPPTTVNTAAAASPAASPLPTAQEPAMARAATLFEQKGTSATEYYYCGAETKKGTPCSRRVKGNTRCYQHTGMPTLLPAEKLKVK